MVAVDEGRLDEAAASAESALRDDPRDAMALAILAQVHLKAGRDGVAYNLFLRADEELAKGGDAPLLRSAIWNNIGHCLAANPVTTDEAERWFQKCLTDGDGDIVSPLANLALVYCLRADHERAVEFARDALKASPTDKAAKMNAAISMLALKQWRDGWDWYDAVLGDQNIRRVPEYVDRSMGWDGKGGTVCIYGEQGLGDQIMFASMVPDAIESADRVVLDVDPRLCGLFQRSFPRSIVTASRATNGILSLPEAVEFDAFHAIGSLGRLFRNSDNDFTGVPYLTPDPLRVRACKAMLGASNPVRVSDRKNVGIMWQGGIKSTREQMRSMKIEDWSPFLELDCEWVSLNHRPGAITECRRFESAKGITVHHWPWVVRSMDYDDTAALVASLDLVITAQTSVAHLAGALGKECWVLVPKPAEWRYGSEGDAMPWYGSVRLFRQETAGDWSGPIEAVKAELEKRGIGKRKPTVEVYGLR